MLDLVTNIVNKVNPDSYENTNPANHVDKRNLESLVHNILFGINPDSPYSSNLWLLDENYCYFTRIEGRSLKEATLDGELVFRDSISNKEARDIRSIDKNANLPRPEILLLPEEHKRLIIVIENPDLNLCGGIDQMRRYAYFLCNYTRENLVIDSFYGYFIGNSVPLQQVRHLTGT